MSCCAVTADQRGRRPSAMLSADVYWWPVPNGSRREVELFDLLDASSAGVTMEEIARTIWGGYCAPSAPRDLLRRLRRKLEGQGFVIARSPSHRYYLAVVFTGSEEMRYASAS